MKFHPVIRHVNFDPQKQKIGGMAIFFVSTDGRLHTRTQVVKPEMVELVEKYLRQKCNIGGHTGGLPILEDGEWEILIEEISKGFCSCCRYKAFWIDTRGLKGRPQSSIQHQQQRVQLLA